MLDCIDRLHQYSFASHFAETAQSETGEEWETTISSFYQLLGEAAQQHLFIFESSNTIDFPLTSMTNVPPTTTGPLS